MQSFPKIQILVFDVSLISIIISRQIIVLYSKSNEVSISVEIEVDRKDADREV